MISFPPCKINLGLNVISKRSDGYHNLETCFYPLPLTDALEILPTDTLSFNLSGNAIPGDAADNLCLKAYKLLQKDFDLKPVAIFLHKVIPSGAGLGGGSSDGAHTLRLLNNLFKLNLTTEKLKSYALQLGSDCPFFIEDKPMLGTGRGEVLTEIDVNLHGKFLVLVKPDIHVSTAEAYGGVLPTVPPTGIKEILEGQPVGAWKDVLINDFEKSVFAKHPLIGAIRQQLYQHGALYASMSGSGSSVFGIFEKPVDLKSQFGDHFYWGNML
ncbi:MAG: 4-(cytidine 5'-diphospho)-2-C-methyl-D-erythritol kinase [Cyclobacteriaceae bacterium]